MAVKNWGCDSMWQLKIGVLSQRGGWAILQYSFCYGQNILKIQPCITMSLFMVETSYYTWMEAAIHVLQCVFLKTKLETYFNWLMGNSPGLKANCHFIFKFLWCRNY